MDKDLEYYLAQARRIVEHREKGATQAIRKVYKSLLDDLNHFIADEYTKYAEDDKLTYSLLQQKGEFASFLEKATKTVEDWYPKASKQTKDLVKNVYEVCYQGMIDGVRKSSNSEELAKNLKGIRNVTPETIKRAVNNPISGLTLSDTLEKNRKEVVYDIKREIGVGLANGDRYSTMAKRITERVDMDYKKAVTIARTETHRVKEAGFHDASTEINDALKNGTTAMRLHKTWVSMKDERVRKSSKANHRKMNGVSVLEDEEFDLGRGVKTQAPGQSGDPHNDINCRCFLKYELKEVEEVEKALETDSEKKQASVEETVVQGSDVSATWERRKDKFDYEIEDVINAQGFDGLPRVVSADEFEEAVKKSKFIAQRTYSAPTQEILDEYRNQLYNGKWYVDCSTGGAQYGQGMYCAADYTGTLTDGIKAEMKHYQALNSTRANPFAHTETLTLDKSAKIADFETIKAEKYSLTSEKFARETLDKLQVSEEKKALIARELRIATDEENKIGRKFERSLDDDEFDKIFDEISSYCAEISRNAKEKERMYHDMDVGSYAVLNGYDAINADGHGESGSYTVVLNRTKVIFKKGD